jgi:hypothetical protein
MDALRIETLDTPALPAHQRRFVKEHATCPMCETDLKLTHDIDKTEGKVKEQAYCPSCRMRARLLLCNLH